jgi:hypothetical protein
MNVTDVLDELDNRVAELAATTGFTVKLGYIGNTGVGSRGQYDDRIWFVWVYNARGGHPLYANNHLTLNRHGVSTDELHDLLPVINEQSLRDALARPGVRPSRVLGVWGDEVTSYEDSASLIEIYNSREAV